jgi:hypothetical protein
VGIIMADKEVLRKTKKLNVFGDTSQPENEVVINPNDGLDIGLYNTRHYLTFKLNLKIENSTLTDMDNMDGCLHLDNDCRSGTVIFSQKLWKKMGKPESVILVNKDENIYIVTR